MTVNFVINMLALRLTHRLYPIHTTNKKLYLSSFTGALFTLSIFFPAFSSIWAGLGVRILATFVMVIIAFPKITLKTLFRLSIILLVVGIVFAGVSLLANIFISDTFLTFPSGAIYLKTSPIALFLCIVLAYILLAIFDKIYDGGSNSQCVHRIIASRGGEFVEFYCFVDTGNKLIESFSGLPVMLVELNTIRTLLTEHEYESILNGELPNSTFRPIFFRTASGNGMLYAFKPDTIYCGNAVLAGYIAVTTNKLDCAGNTALAGLKFFTAVK